MKRNKQHYSPFKNPFFAISGIAYAFKNETSFVIEATLLSLEFIALIFIDIEPFLKLALVVTGLLILMAELFNTAVELAVDIASPDYLNLAKAAKDTASGGVFMTFIIHFSIIGYAWLA